MNTREDSAKSIINKKNPDVKTISETEALDKLIIATEQQRAYELALLKEQYHVVYESLKPINLIKKGFHDMTASSDIKNFILNNAIGLGTGILSKKLLVGSTHNPVKRVLGTVIEFAVANLVSKYGGIASIGRNLLKRFVITPNTKKEVQKY